MADCPNNNCSENYRSVVKNSKLLVVGAGGIGCELLKDLVLTGFHDIHIIDLDTIDVSNLNRQFLFQKQHIGKSKAVVARESALKLRPKASITAYHDTVTNLRYGVDFFQQFSAVTNALDNRAARSHVNRMCLAADVPLVESGTAGYLGQVTVHKKGVTECYECQPKPPQKTFPGCTIRNTPSEPIHCIVWAKHLFNQLFGEEDADEDVSPDIADTDRGAEDGAQYRTNETGNIQRISTREWAKASNFEYLKLFNKLFQDDIYYLLSMEKLWRKRRAPIPLDWENLPDAVAGSSQQKKPSIKDQEIWSIKECASVFKESLDALRRKAEDLNGIDVLVWDKDDKHCMNFVTACANLRAHCFGIPTKSTFDVKSLAGNIIPAIATTNAIIAGIIVLQLLKVLKGQMDASRTIILNKHAAVRKTLLTPARLEKPNPKCYACSISAVVSIRMNVKTVTVKTLEEKILKEQLHMIAPDVEIDDGKGTILISSDPEEMGDIDDKPLKEFGIGLGTRLNCDDFFQHFKFVLSVIPEDNMPDDKEFEILGDISTLQPQEHTEKMDVCEEVVKDVEITVVDENEDVEVVNEGSAGISVSKRKLTEDGNGEIPSKKKQRTFSTTTEIHDVDIL